MPVVPLLHEVLPALTNALILSNPLHAVGAAVIAFFIVIGVMLLLDIDIDTKVVAGVILLLIGITVLFFLINGEDLGGITIGLIAALAGKEIIERMALL